MKILIIRHGDPDYSIDSLTPKGWREAELLSDRLTQLNIQDYYCSPRGRSRDTVKLALEKLHKQAEILPWLTEFEGKVVSPFDAQYKIPWNLMPQYWTKEPLFFDKDRWMEAPIMTTASVPRIYQETCEGLDNLLLKYGYRRDGLIFKCEKNLDITIALVCHFGLGLVMLSYMMGMPLPQLWQCFFLPASSVTTLVTEERLPGEVFFKCVQVGDTSHLYAGGEPVSQAGLFPEFYEK